MTARNCLCGARPEVKLERRPMADGGAGMVCWVECPVCGQLGPRVMRPADADEAQLRAEAIQAWNEMLQRARPAGNF